LPHLFLTPVSPVTLFHLLTPITFLTSIIRLLPPITTMIGGTHLILIFVV
jgi:hypothetical protein